MANNIQQITPTFVYGQGPQGETVPVEWRHHLDGRRATYAWTPGRALIDWFDSRGEWTSRATLHNARRAGDVRACLPKVS